GPTRRFRGVKNPRRWSGMGQTQRGPSGNVKNSHCSLGGLFGVMVDDSDHLKHTDHAIAMLKAVYLRDGADAGVAEARHMISGAGALSTCEYGPDEARRILRTVGGAQGQTS